jgi:hypothetical protein
MICKNEQKGDPYVAAIINQGYNVLSSAISFTELNTLT